VIVFFFLVLKVNVNVIFWHNSLGSLSCPGTDAYTWSTHIHAFCDIYLTSAGGKPKGAISTSRIRNYAQQ